MDSINQSSKHIINDNNNNNTLLMKTNEENINNNSPNVSESLNQSDLIGKNGNERNENEHCVGEIDIINKIDSNQDIICLNYTEAFDHIAAGLADGTIKIFKPITGELISVLYDDELAKNPGKITAVKRKPFQTISPLSHTITSTYSNGLVKCWHFPSTKCLYTVQENRQIFGLTYHPRIPKYLTFGDESQLRLYDEESKRFERVFDASPRTSPHAVEVPKYDITGACFKPQSHFEFISGGTINKIQFWDVRQKDAVRHIPNVELCGDSLDISSNGKEILSCCYSSSDYPTIQMWDYGTAKLIATLTPDGPETSCCYSTGRFVARGFAACGGSNSFRIINVHTNQVAAELTDLPGKVSAIDIGPKTPRYRIRSPIVSLPKLTFSNGKSIYEIEVQIN